jgi:hypothetical protein
MLIARLPRLYACGLAFPLTALVSWGILGFLRQEDPAASAAFVGSANWVPERKLTDYRSTSNEDRWVAELDMATQCGDPREKCMRTAMAVSLARSGSISANQIEAFTEDNHQGLVPVVEIQNRIVSWMEGLDVPEATEASLDQLSAACLVMPSRSLRSSFLRNIGRDSQSGIVPVLVAVSIVRGSISPKEIAERQTSEGLLAAAAELLSGRYKRDDLVADLARAYEASGQHVPDVVQRIALNHALRNGTTSIADLNDSQLANWRAFLPLRAGICREAVTQAIDGKPVPRDLLVAATTVLARAGGSKEALTLAGQLPEPTREDVFSAVIESAAKENGFDPMPFVTSMSSERGSSALTALSSRFLTYRGLDKWVGWLATLPPERAATIIGSTETLNVASGLFDDEHADDLRSAIAEATASPPDSPEIAGFLDRIRMSGTGKR